MHHLAKQLPAFKNLPYFISGNEVTIITMTYLIMYYNVHIMYVFIYSQYSPGLNLCHLRTMFQYVGMKRNSSVSFIIICTDDHVYYVL